MKKIAFQGERGAFSELAAKEFFKSRGQLVPVEAFEDVFTAVANGTCDHGIIPIENSLAGSIHQNYDLLLQKNLVITGEILLQISHFLIAGKKTRKNNLKQIFSHPQAIAQCKQYLQRFPRSAIMPFSNTAAAVKKIKDEDIKDAAAIGSMQAAIDYDMKVLASHIEDNKNNMTRFIILSKNTHKPKRVSEAMKTSIVFSTKNIPGALFKCLSVFALRDIDLFKIESRPTTGKHFEYLFYLDFKGYVEDEAQRNAINHLQEITTLYRMLGSYPSGQLVVPVYRKRRPV